MTLTCTATNGAGLTTSVSVTIKIDKTAPEIAGLPATCSLWPPNGLLIPVATVLGADSLSGIVAGSFAVSGTSNEPSGPDQDIVVTPTANGGWTVQLRAQRLGGGTGRVYMLSATAVDQAGNTTTQSAMCVVPHDQR